MATEAGDVQALLGAIVIALQAPPDGSPALPKAQADQVFLAKAMQILSGDWTPFDAVRPTVQEFVATEVAKVNGDRVQYAHTMANLAHKTLAENAQLNLVLAEHCREESDPFGGTLQVLTKHLPILVNLILDHVETAETKFSDAFKAAAIELTGEWMEMLGGCMNDGTAGLTPFFQKLSMIGSAQIAQKYPQHATTAMFGFPMLLNMLNQFHQIYRQSHSLQ